MRTAKRKTTRNASANGRDLKTDWLKIKNVMQDTATHVKGKANHVLTDSFGGLKSKTTKIQNKVQNYTTKKPIKSLGIALAVGVVLGMFIKRR